VPLLKKTITGIDCWALHNAWQCHRRAAYKCDELTPPHCSPEV
jgi:hypothetical protein